MAITYSGVTVLHIACRGEVSRGHIVRCLRTGDCGHFGHPKLQKPAPLEFEGIFDWAAREPDQLVCHNMIFSIDKQEQGYHQLTMLKVNMINLANETLVIDDFSRCPGGEVSTRPPKSTKLGQNYDESCGGPKCGWACKTVVYWCDRSTGVTCI